MVLTIIATGFCMSVLIFLLVWAVRHMTSCIKELTTGIQAAYKVGFRHGFFRQEGYDPDKYLLKVLEAEQEKDEKEPKKRKGRTFGDGKST